MEKIKHRWYDVIVAWASGEKIQYSSNDRDWNDFIYEHKEPNCVPSFNSSYYWRIKPKTVTKRYRMALVAAPIFNPVKKVVSLDLSNYSLDFPAEREVHGFIRWVGDMVEVEIENE